MVRSPHALAAAILATAIVAPTSSLRADPNPHAVGEAIKIGVRQPGWVRVSQADLLAAGLPAGVDPRNLQLFADGHQVPIFVAGESDGHFDAGDDVEFYGVGVDTTWTDTQVYWLVAGSSAGLRYTLETPPAGGTPAQSFLHTETRRDRLAYFAALRNGDDSNFFGPLVRSSSSPSQTLTLHHIDGAGPAAVHVSVQGITSADHSIGVTVNGTSVGALAFYGEIFQEGVIPISASLLVEGTNTIVLSAQLGSSDTNYLSSVAVDYQHAYAADSDQLTMTAAGGTHLRVSGFTTSDVRVIDLSDGVELAASVVSENGGYSASFDVPAGDDRTLLAFAGAAVQAAALVTANAPSSWQNPHTAEVVFLTHPMFAEHLQPLVDLRRSEGWSVALVNVDEVYDEFGWGKKSADAIREFLKWATDHWTVRPRFAVLVGDASVDPRNFLNKGFFDYIPTKLADTAPLETASDDWLADFDGGGVPAIALGRIPVDTVAQLDVVVGKLLAYPGTADLGRGALFVADATGSDGFNFETPSSENEQVLGSLLPVDNLFRGQVDPSTATTSLLAKLNAGPFLVNYLGHGSVSIWDNLFSNSNAGALTNSDHLSIYLSMDCLNGFYHDVYTVSLAETLLESPGGAIAVLASSTLADAVPQVLLDKLFLQQLTQLSLGEALLLAKRFVTDSDVKQTYILFGDPTLFGRPTVIADGGAPDLAGGPDDGGVSANDGAAGPSGGSDAGESPHGASGCQCDLGVRDASARSAWPAIIATALAALYLTRRRFS